MMFWARLFQNKSKDMEVVPVKSVKIHRKNKRLRRAELLVYGYLPTPAYEFDHIHVHVQEDEIKITPWAQRDPEKIVIQISVPFHERCKIKGLQTHQIYKVRVEGSEGAETENLKF